MQIIIQLRLFYINVMMPNWQYIVPGIMFVAWLIWMLTMYRKGNFQWLPAWAIARVTVLDSVGRLEVIFLLLIGMLLVGVFGFVLYWPQTREILLDSPVIKSYIEQRLGGDVGISLSPTEIEVMLADILGMAAMFFGEFFVAIIGFVLGMFVLPNEMNRGVVFSILPKPLTKSEYVFGKFLGTWFIVTGCFLILALELYLIEFVWFATHQAGPFELFKMGLHFPVNVLLLRAMILFPFKYATLLLIIMGMSLRMPEAPAGIVGLAIFVSGHFSDRIYEMSRDLVLANPFMSLVFKFTYWLLPHLTEAFSLTILDVDATTLNQASMWLATDWGVVWGWVWQITVYNTILLWMLIWLFRRKSF